MFNVYDMFLICSGNNNNFRKDNDDASVYKKCVRRLLSALPDDPNDYRDSLITRNGRWLKGTCEWILKTNQYMDWLNADAPSQLLWITGDPGKGKTMLSLFLINHREAVVKKEPERRKLIHFFCGAQDGRNTGVAILRSLIYQLLDDSQEMFRHIRNAYAKHGRALFGDDRFETLWKVFDAMVRDPRLDSVTCILDGLDECVEESLNPFWIKIRGLILPGSPTTPTRPQARLKVVVTSRNYPESFENFLHCFPRLRLEFELNDEIKKDVERYIDHRMQELACNERKKPTLHLLRANVKRKLLDGSNGTYLWVNFAISSLKKEACPELEAALDKFPRGLDGMYRRMLLSIQHSKREVVISILRWVATAFRPLTLEALGVALALPKAVGQDLDDAVNDFVEYAGDLLLVTRKDPKSDRSQKIVIPVHASMTDFLWHIDSSLEELAEFRLDVNVCHSSLANRVLDYAMKIFQDDPDVDVWGHPDDASWNKTYHRYPLLEYALMAALRHLSTASKDAPDMSHALFDEKTKVHQLWLQAQCLAVGYLWLFGKAHVVHVAALLGYANMIKFYLNRGVCHVDIRDDYQRTPLFYATLREHADVVKFLLQSGADSNAQDFVSQTPLHIACATESQDIVAELLNVGADPNAVSLARGSVWGGEDVGSILDADRISGEDDALRSGKDHTTGTALHFAAEYNHAKHIRLLLGRGTELNALDERGRTALHRATRADSFHGESVNVLVNAGLSMLVKDNQGETAFHTAAYDCDNDDPEHIDAMKIMLNAGFPVDLQTTATNGSPGGVTALQIACGSGLKSAVEMLIESGADVSHRDNRGRTPLHWLAARRQDITNCFATVIASRLLWLMSESAISCTDAEGRTAYDVAIGAWAEYEKALLAASQGDMESREFRKSWLAHTNDKQPVHDVIANYTTMIQMTLPKEAEQDVSLLIPDPTEKDKANFEKLSKQRRDYRERMRTYSST